MKKYFIVVLGMILGFGGISFADEQAAEIHSSFSIQLEKAVQSRASIKQNPGMGRFGLMRYYFPNNQIHKDPGFWARWGGCDEDTLVRSQAVYLYNMYVSTAAYKVDIPRSLTVDYVGVLDSFNQCANGFSVRDSVSFYRKHRGQIQSLLREFFARQKLPAYRVNDAKSAQREEGFLNLLARTPALKEKFPVYQAVGTSRLTRNFNSQDVAILQNFVRRSLAVGKNKKVTFTEIDPLSSALDTPLSNGKITRTVERSANEECAACSYLLGREMCQQIACKHRNWGSMRIYRVEVRDNKSWYLKTATGSKNFTLANGKKASPWEYHVATLVIMNLDGAYTPYILDPLLAGDKPLSPNAWFRKFDLTNAFFLIQPFSRSAAAEKQFKN